MANPKEYTVKLVCLNCRHFFRMPFPCGEPVKKWIANHATKCPNCQVDLKVEE